MDITTLLQDFVFVLGIAGVVFGIYQYFKNPQISEDKKSALLAQQVKYTAESVEERFILMQKNFESLLLQSNNHIHTVDTKVDTLAADMTQMSREIVRLATIIEERIPKK